MRESCHWLVQVGTFPRQLLPASDFFTGDMMSKHKQTGEQTIKRDDELLHYYITQAGVRIKIQAISPFLLRKLSQSSDEPVHPTYEVETVAGTIEVHPHNESTLTTDEQRAEWEEYQAALDKARADKSSKMVRTIFTMGIELDDGWEQGDWILQQEFVGIEIPEDPMELRLHYIQTVLIGSVADMSGLIGAVMRLTGVDEELVEQSTKSFQRAVEKSPADRGTQTPPIRGCGAIAVFILRLTQRSIGA